MRRLYSAAQAQRELGIKASTVRSWARRGRLYSYGLDRRNQPLYDGNDLVRLRSRMRARVAGRHPRMKCVFCDAPVAEDAPVDLCWAHCLEVHRHVVVEMRPNRREAAPLPSVPTSVVYYVRVGEQIKIGTTQQILSRRFTDLPPGRQLLAVEPGGEQVEKARHTQFALERVAVNREWFTPSARLWIHIADLREKYGEPTGEAHGLAS